jgi:hypothetical protein
LTPLGDPAALPVIDNTANAARVRVPSCGISKLAVSKAYSGITLTLLSVVP